MKRIRSKHWDAGGRRRTIEVSRVASYFFLRLRESGREIPNPQSLDDSVSGAPCNVTVKSDRPLLSAKDVG